MKKLFFALLALAVLCSCGNSGVRSGSGSGADGRSRAIDAELLAVLEQNAYQSEDNPFFTASIKDVVRDPSVTLDTTTTYRVLAVLHSEHTPRRIRPRGLPVLADLRPVLRRAGEE